MTLRNFLLGMVAACACAPAQHGSYENLNSTVWVQTSVEYKATLRQTYRAAEASLLRGIEDRMWTAAIEQTRDASQKPPAVILDLDETVLDNSPFQARMVTGHKTYTEEAWQAWVAEGKAGLVPGAGEFLAAAHGHGVAIFYLSNRVCNPDKADDPTVAVLKAHSLPMAQGRLLCKVEGNSDKTPRRTQVAANYRVILLIGDDFGDFLTPGKTREARDAQLAAWSRYFGERWFMIPNPTYGSWERSVGYTVDEKLKALRK